MKSLLTRIENYNNKHRGYVRKLFVVAEVFLIIIAIPIVFLFSNRVLELNLVIDIPQYLILLLIVLISWYIKEKINAQALLPRTQRYLNLIFKSSRSFLILSLVVLSSKFIFGLNNIPVLFILIYIVFFYLIILFGKVIGYRFLKIYRANGYNLHYVLIIADGFSDQIIVKLMEEKEWGFKILGIVTNSKLISKKYGDRIAIIPEDEDLMPILDTIVVDEIIYSKYKIDEKQVKSVMSLCNEVGIIFRLQSTVSPIEHENFQFKTLSESKYLRLVDGPANHYSLMFKTISDYYVSIMGMIILSPVFLLIAIMIKLDSKGPIFFKQERIGLRGRKFTLYKFRTMVVDAEKKLNELKNQNESDGPVFKIKNDPRITRIGKFLRKTGLDELPQLQNVILGEMSLIGPRPPLEAEVKQYERWQLRRLSVKPGITCSWQVVPDRNVVKFDNWMKMDLNYIDNWSLTKDIKLIFKTVRVLFFAEGR